MGGVICCYVSAFKTRLQQLDVSELKSIMAQATQNKSMWNKCVLTSTTGAIGHIKAVVEQTEELTSSKAWTEHLSDQNRAFSRCAVKVQIGNSTFTFPSDLVFKIEPLRLPQSDALLEQFYAYEYALRNDSTVTLLNNGFKSLSVNSKDGKFRKEVNFWKYKDPFLNLDTLPAPVVPIKQKAIETKSQLTPKPNEEDENKRKVDESQSIAVPASNSEPPVELALDPGNTTSTASVTQAPPQPQPTTAPARPRLIFTAKKKLSQSQQSSTQPTANVAPPPPITEVTPTPTEQKPEEFMVIETKFPMEK